MFVYPKLLPIINTHPALLISRLTKFSTPVNENLDFCLRMAKEITFYACIWHFVLTVLRFKDFFFGQIRRLQLLCVTYTWKRRIESSEHQDAQKVRQLALSLCERRAFTNIQDWLIASWHHADCIKTSSEHKCFGWTHFRVRERFLHSAQRTVCRKNCWDPFCEMFTSWQMEIIPNCFLAEKRGIITQARTSNEIKTASALAPIKVARNKFWVFLMQQPLKSPLSHDIPAPCFAINDEMLMNFPLFWHQMCSPNDLIHDNCHCLAAGFPACYKCSSQQTNIFIPHWMHHHRTWRASGVTRPCAPRQGFPPRTHETFGSVSLSLHILTSLTHAVLLNRTKKREGDFHRIHSVMNLSANACVQPLPAAPFRFYSFGVLCTVTAGTERELHMQSSRVLYRFV